MTRTIRDEDRGARATEFVTIDDVTALRSSDKALLCVIDGEHLWVPQSQIADDSEVYERGHEGKLVVTHWWASERGLV